MAKFTAITLLALSLGLLGTVYAQNLDMSGSEGCPESGHEWL
jgi:hypothetical protein